MKILKKTLAVGLSLALCASMVAPAFAASFDELQNVIDTQTSLRDENDAFRIEYDDGNVTLYEDVTRGEDEAGKSITVSGEDKNITIDLNGQTIDGGNKNGSVIKVTDGASLTIDDSSEGGTIKGGNATFGGGVYVEGADLTLKDGTISENTSTAEGGGVYIKDGSTFTMEGGEISDNTAKNSGGGVFVANYTETLNSNQEHSQFVMNGGTISGNSTGGNGKGTGGGVAAYGDKQENAEDAVVINGGEITGNTTGGDGGGVAVQNGAMSMTGGTVSGNTAGNHGGGIYSYDSKTEISDAVISGNEATNGGGIYAQNAGTTVKVTGSTISGNSAATGGGIFNRNGDVIISGSSEVYANTATNHSDDVYSNGGSLTLYRTVNGEGPVLDEDGKERPVTGWYRDGATLSDGTLIRWGDEYTKYNLPDPGGKWTGKILCLKAAHDQYFNVEYTDGVGGTLFDNQEYEVENESPVPVFNGEIPTRDGYTFAGWLVDSENFDPETGIVTGTLTLVASWTLNITPPAPEDPGIEVEDPDVPLGGEPEVEINDPAVPLASGPVTRAQFVDYLWRHEGEPAPVADSGLFEDVTEEHEYSPAMAWAKSIGIIEAYEDGTFEPDELVTVAAVRGILTRFAAYADMAMPELTTLTGGDDEAVLNCSQVLAEFFGEEYEIPEIDDAA